MDIDSWLGGIGLEQYAQTFRDNAIDADVLRDLTDEHLRQLGLPLGARLKLLRAVAAIGTTSEQTLASPEITPPAPRTDAERRQVTVMFSDLVGSTELSVRMDPEDLREVISAYQKCVADTVRRFGGFVAKYMGDGVLVYFGYPQAHEDDAERAVRVGLELIGAVGAIKSSAPVQTRVGIATGMVVVGDLIGSGEAHERGIVGETPNLAARLQGIAEPNTVVIAEATRKLLGNLFELGDLGAKDLKGIAEPMRAYAALRASSAEGRFEALHASGLTALVGRDEELELLLRRWSRAKTGEGQVVLLSGEAGIGKSRLAAALLERLADEPHTRLRYFCSPQHTDSAFYPIIGQMERAAAAYDDTPQAKLDKLDALLAQTSTPKQDATLFAQMLSLPNDGRYPALDLAPEQRRQRTLEALTAQLAGLAGQRPVLMIVEDTHWVDPTSQEVFGRTVDQIKNLPVLLIVTFRPEFNAPWVGQSHVTSLTLNRLGEREAAAIIAHLVGNKELPADVMAEIVERTDGIPLFVEEMTKAVLEAEGESEARRTAAAVPSPALAVPASLHASLMARLDRLGSAKEVAQVGAAIGREFSHALLASVMRKPEAELGSALDHLIAAGLLFRQGVPPHSSYLFKHALVQDAAYGTLLREPRRALHACIAETLEGQFAEIVASQPELVARHSGEAGLTKKATNYWLLAGRSAAGRYANLEAIVHLQRGIEAIDRLPESSTKDRMELDLHLALGPCIIATQGAASDMAAATFARARQICERLDDAPPEYLHVMNWLHIALAVRGELPQAREAAGKLIDLAEARGDRPALLNNLRAAGLSSLLMGRIVEACDWLEKNVKEYGDSSAPEKVAARAAGQDAGAAGSAVMSWALWVLGRVDKSVAQIDAALQRADALKDDHHTQAYVSHYASVLYALRGDPGSAYQQAVRCFTLSERYGFRQWRNPSRAIRAVCTALLDPSEKIDPASIELDQYCAGYHLGITVILTLLCEAMLARHQLDAVAATVEQALAKCNANTERFFEAELHRLKARVLLVGNEPNANMQAQSLLDKALTIARSQSAHSLELRAARDLAVLLRDQGEPQQARELLAPVYGWFTEGFDTVDLKEAKALLEELHA